MGGTLLSGAIGTIDITTGRATKFSTPLLSTMTQVTASTSQEQSCTSGTCTPVARTCVASPLAPGPNPPPPTTCQTATTGPTAVLACTPVTATTGNAWTTTTCGSNVTGPAPVTACVPMAASGSNAWTQTSCTGITPGSQAYALTTGPDGAIWFTE